MNDVERFKERKSMIICCLWMTIVLSFPTPTSSFDGNLSIDTNVGKRVRMECELNTSIIQGNKKGLWLRLEDAEVFFYGSSRINADQRFQIEQRSNLHMINGSSFYQIFTYSFIINDVHLSDRGTYSCQADNKILRLFTLNIVERPHFLTNGHPTSFRTHIGANISLICEAHGQPEPHLYWLKRLDDYNQRMMINCSTTPSICQLNLIDIDRWHHGIYECVAVNTAGSIGRFYELDVQFPPVVHFLTAQLPRSIGDEVTMTCLIDTNPEANIRWTHRFDDHSNQEMDLSQQFERETVDGNQHRIWSIEYKQLNLTNWQTSLFIKRFPKRLFNSKFICRASNEYGDDEQTISIIEKHQVTRNPSSPPSITYPTLPISTEKQLINITEFLLEETEEIISSRSRRLSFEPFALFILIFCTRKYRP